MVLYVCQKCATKTNKQKALTPKSLQSCQTCSNLSAARPKFLSTTSLADCRTTGTICASARVSRLRQCCLRFAPTTAKICTRATHARSLARCSGNTNERPTPNRRTHGKNSLLCQRMFDREILRVGKHRVDQRWRFGTIDGRSGSSGDGGAHCRTRATKRARESPPHANKENQRVTHAHTSRHRGKTTQLSCVIVSSRVVTHTHELR